MLKKKKAFTMVETTIIIAVMATLLSVMIPSFSNVMENANKSSMTKTLSSSYDAIKMIDLKDGTMEYANGVILAKDKDSQRIYYSIVSNGKLSVTYTTNDKQRVSSIGNDYFCLPKCEGNYEAKTEDNGTLKVYYNQEVENNHSDQEEFVRTQAVHIVRGEDNVLDNAGNGGSVFDMAEKKDLDGGIIMSAKFISTGKSAPLKVEFVPGITNPLDFSLEHRYSYEITPSTCTTGGLKDGTCIYCNKTTIEDVPPLGHDYTTHGRVNPTCTETGLEEYNTCNRCGYVDGYQEIPALGHDYGTPTYTWNGVSSCSASTKCTRCTDTQTENSTAVRNVKTAATCTEMGTSIYTASFTKTYKGNPLFNTQTKENQDIPLLEHSWDSGTVTTAATCTTEGNKRYTCTVCSTTKDETIPANGSHSPVTDPAVAATCTETGLTEGSHCSACGKVLTAQQTVAATGHSYTVTKSATCTSDGTKTCSKCRGTLEIPALGHDIHYTSGSSPTCTSSGYSSGEYCTRPGCNYDTTTSYSKLGHNYVSKGNYDATCGSSGWTGRTECSRCGSVGSSGSSVPATGDHSYWPTSTVTCTSPTTIKCSVCGDTATIPAQGHWWKTTSSATCTSSGTKTCSECGETESIPAMGHDLVSSGTCTQNCSRCSYIKDTHDMEIIPDDPHGTLKCTKCGMTTQFI